MADGPPLPRSEAEEDRGTSQTLTSCHRLTAALPGKRGVLPAEVPPPKRCPGPGVAAATPRPDGSRPPVRAGVGSRGRARLVGDGGLGLGCGDGTAGLGCRDSGGPPSPPKGGWWLVVPMKSTANFQLHLVPFHGPGRECCPLSSLGGGAGPSGPLGDGGLTKGDGKRKGILEVGGWRREGPCPGSS